MAVFVTGSTLETGRKPKLAGALPEHCRDLGRTGGVSWRG
jgi:hypothetical protein